jgi:S-adenosylmethionine:tRNA ribosyltransferase-isomerase
MKLSDFDFELPEDLIATRPSYPRSSSRMLVAQNGQIEDRTASDLPAFLKSGDRVIFNDTKVLSAYLEGVRTRKATQGQAGRAKVTLNLLTPLPDGSWRVLVRPLRKLAAGDEIEFSIGSARVIGRDESTAIVRFDCGGLSLETFLAKAGQMPLPPYIASRRMADALDRTDYQTVFARNIGAVAAPTASLHFDETLLEGLKSAGIDTSFVTLHVGGGTFLPVKTDDIADHQMHAEWGEVSQTAADEIAATKAAGGRIIPVGTTALRLIEAAADTGAVAPWSGDTDIFITPGYKWRCADGLVTNFHLPKSTLIMLVAAMMGQEFTKTIYDHAIAKQYRFFSYGDASLLLPKG